MALPLLEVRRDLLDKEPDVVLGVDAALFILSELLISGAIHAWLASDPQGPLRVAELPQASFRRLSQEGEVRTQAREMVTAGMMIEPQGPLSGGGLGWRLLFTQPGLMASGEASTLGSPIIINNPTQLIQLLDTVAVYFARQLKLDAGVRPYRVTKLDPADAVLGKHDRTYRLYERATAP